MSIYFYHLKESNKVKIGCSTNIPQRIKQLNTAIHEQGKLVRIIEEQDFEAEKWLHEYFKKYRIKGEWFNFTEEMLTVKLPKDIVSDFIKYKHLAINKGGCFIPNGAFLVIPGDSYEERLEFVRENIKKLKRLLP